MRAADAARPWASFVEIHVPLLPTPDPPDRSHLFPRIEEVEEFLSDLEDDEEFGPGRRVAVPLSAP